MRKMFSQTGIAAILFFSFHLYSETLNAQASVSFAQRGPVLTLPMEVHTAPGDNTRLFIVEKAGSIRIWNGTTLLPTHFLNISSIVQDGGEQGLLSMAFHPNYQSNGFFFVYYNDNSGNLTIARYHVSADPNVATGTADPVTPLVSIPKPFSNHNGGHIQFKPEGGINYLYVATGDGGDGNDPQNNSQRLSSRLGKMIRIDADDVTSPTMEIMAWGLRNPFRWSFDRLTGDIWIGDVGQGAKEEISFRAGGAGAANFGWPCFEGTRNNSADGPPVLEPHCDTVAAAHIAPVFEYENPPCCGTSVIGGYRYRGSAYPQFQGYYMSADYFDGRVWFTRSNGSGGWITSAPQTGLTANITSFSEAYNGDSLFALSHSTNRFYKIVPNVVTPVSLLNFSGTTSQGYNDLKWATAFEENIEKYIIEFSTDGRNYSEVGSVSSIGSTDLHNYTFRHNTFTTGKIYYRLRIAELSGISNYSPTIVLGSKERAKAIVFPTIITSGSVNVTAVSPVEKVEIMNISGQKVVVRDMTNATGFFQVPLPSLPQGIYYIQLSSKDYHQTEKIIVQ
jgi:glucose/arabinose dehydrogenase